MTPPRSGADELAVSAWADPVVEAVGFPIEHPYLERCWTPLLGPTTTALWRRLGRIALAQTGVTRIGRDQLAAQLGIGSGAALDRSLRRLVDFGAARLVGNAALSVRVAVAPLSERRLRRLPGPVRAEHAEAMAERRAARPNPLAQAAFDYARRGWPVLPLRAGAKVPDGDLVPHGLTEASADPARIRQWWAASPLANVGIATGVGIEGTGIDVVDIDPPGPEHGPPDVLAQVREGLVTPGAIVSSGRGWHLYFAASGLPTRAGVLPGVDLRGRGGYIVAPPSIHPSGSLYRFTDAHGRPVGPPPVGPMPAAPGWLGELSQPKASGPPAPRPRVGQRLDGYARAALTEESAAVAVTPEGARNDRLNRAAFSIGTLVGAGGIDYDIASAHLVSAGVSAGLGEDEARRTVGSGLSAGTGRPRHIAEESDRARITTRAPLAGPATDAMLEAPAPGIRGSAGSAAVGPRRGRAR